ncbi:MAG: hypothetical protein ACXWSD_05415 [Bdellovibrionota bacterium]
MRFPKLLAPLAVALLSLGFLGHSPVKDEGTLRHVSSCEDSPVATTPFGSASPFSSNLFTAVQGDPVTSWYTAYSLYLQSLQVNAVLAHPVLNVMGTPIAFPSPQIPSIDGYAGNFNVSSPLSNLMFGGLGSNAQVQNLLAPLAGSNSGTVTPLAIQNSALSGAPTGNLPLGNAAIANTAPAAVPAGTAGIENSSLIGSRLLPFTVGNNVSFRITQPASAGAPKAAHL